MIYKGQKLSDNLTQSQRDMFKYMIDNGHSVDDIVGSLPPKKRRLHDRTRIQRYYSIFTIKSARARRKKAMRV
jgi:hypothetical protein